MFSWQHWQWHRDLNIQLRPIFVNTTSSERLLCLLAYKRRLWCISKDTTPLDTYDMYDLFKGNLDDKYADLIETYFLGRQWRTALGGMGQKSGIDW